MTCSTIASVRPRKLAIWRRPPARVVSPAVAPDRPVKPNKKLVVALAFVASLMLTAMIAFLADALDNVIRGVQDFEEKLGEPLLAAVPLLNLKTQPHNSATHAFFERSGAWLP